jgi:hypothetical protein
MQYAKQDGSPATGPLGGRWYMYGAAQIVA